MADIIHVYQQIKALLTSAGVTVLDGPADALPTSGGRVTQCAVIYPLVGTPQYRPLTPAATGRVDGATVVCVGATTLDCLAVIKKVRAALDGAAIAAAGGNGSRLQEAGSTNQEPTIEPATDPTRVSLSLQFTAVTKG